MTAYFWENGEWTAWYEAVQTPFGTLTRLVPGSLHKKEHARTPEHAEGSEPALPTDPQNANDADGG